MDDDEGVVRSLLAAQHPDLAALELRPVDGGWDNRMWRLGDDLAVRLPRTDRAPGLLGKERRWLPELAPLLPLPVPVPVRDGQPSAAFPQTWSIVAWVPGVPADRTPITRGAETLAEFLRALHRPAPADAPANGTRGGPLAALTGSAAEWLTVLDDEEFDVDAVREVWERAVAAPAWSGPPVWLHADLHPANVVVVDGAPSGVVDFGDLCAGDPATDLCAAWLLLPEGTAVRFFQTYAYADEATVDRALGWAVLRSLGLIGIGQNGERGRPGGKPTWLPAGRAALGRTLAYAATRRTLAYAATRQGERSSLG